MPKKKEIGVQDMTKIDTKRVFGLKRRRIMISIAVAELGPRFRVSNALWIHLPRTSEIFDIIGKKQSHVEKLSLLQTHVGDKPEKVVKRSGSGITPRDEFSDLCGFAGESRKDVRTSLAGLALDSATSSGLGRASHSVMQNLIQAPPGTTRQAGLYTS
ncbi:hypothetical protein TNCV_918041 [Trichonephila clavipes]|nr:hypothetical protein TNCV_918041 [Trichonephila clavipes]